MKLCLSYGAHSDLLTAATILYELGYLSKGSDLIYFFEKPWKWQKELDGIEWEGETIEVTP